MYGKVKLYFESLNNIIIHDKLNLIDSKYGYHYITCCNNFNDQKFPYLGTRNVILNLNLNKLKNDGYDSFIKEYDDIKLLHIISKDKKEITNLKKYLDKIDIYRGYDYNHNIDVNINYIDHPNISIHQNQKYKLIYTNKNIPEDVYKFISIVYLNTLYKDNCWFDDYTIQLYGFSNDIISNTQKYNEEFIKNIKEETKTGNSDWRNNYITEYSNILYQQLIDIPYNSRQYFEIDHLLSDFIDFERGFSYQYILNKTVDNYKKLYL